MRKLHIFGVICKPYSIVTRCLKQTLAMMDKTFELNTGHNIPLIGFGTFQIHGQELIYQVLDYALGAGYRHIDTAVVYRNEEYIGSALKTLLPKYNLKREDIFITSKLISQAGKDEGFVEQMVRRSLANLQTDYLDLYLIHWPGVSGMQVTHPDNVKYRKETWKALCKMQKGGYLRSIGVSNYTVKHLKEMMAYCNGVIPSVNQVEWHPYYYQSELLEFCRKERIFLQAYSSLGSSNTSELRNDETVKAVASGLQKTPAQVLLRWAVQQNIGILPKARSREHIEENLALEFEIPAKEMKQLNELQNNVGHKFAWNPETVV
ncbi:aldose reductase A-like [Anopheles funestus]|uniref:aldose reductase A-like n=1 Tax=Anopheles funestus TaxID=62324 RepID=UPI0020C6AC17|nr:aldose reductase A-like [Anopheles funestus]